MKRKPDHGVISPIVEEKPTLNGDELIDELEKFYENIDIGLKIRLPTLNKPVSCDSCTRPGCCYQKVMISFHEALPIVRYLKEQNRDTPELRAKLREFGDAMEGSAPDDWMEGARPCVFLGDNRCSIYEKRPIHCRVHLVVSDPERCQPEANGSKIEHVNVNMLLEQMVPRSRQIHKALGLKENNKRIMMGVLPRVLLIALEALDLGSQQAFADHIRAQKWPSDTSLDAGWNDGVNPFGAHP